MLRRQSSEKTIEWEDVIGFLSAKKNYIEKLERGYSQRRKNLEVG